jgi:predicted Zn-dependent peptidase
MIQQFNAMKIFFKNTVRAFAGKGVAMCLFILTVLPFATFTTFAQNSQTTQESTMNSTAQQTTLRQTLLHKTELPNTNAPNVLPVKFDYETAPNDPLQTKIYTLKNGLKVYMSVNPLEPRIFTNIVVRAGSKQDPAETTGLAHYLEHMMFKGTSQIGSLNWEKEKAILTEIADLYEKHRAETDVAARKVLYSKIDSVSNEAAKLVAANEYDKLVSSMGAKATNAYTSNEQTVYVNDVPSNELERWVQLEAERFKMVVLRLFHTELEAVYEEFNIGQDNDGRKVFQGLMTGLFPTHPYGTQSTIGKGEHLKSPSHYNILGYFEKYYVPNNLAIVISGDFDPDQAVALVEKYFGDMKPKAFPEWTYEKQAPLKAVVRTEVFGQQSPEMRLAWRVNGYNSADAEVATLVSAMLYNQQAGLIDLDLVQKQQVLEASAFVYGLSDYAMLSLGAKPREGQTLEELEKLLLQQIDRIRKGDFPEWLIGAVLKDFKYSQTKSYENNGARVGTMTDAFVKGMKWADYTARFERLKKITKAQVMEFAARVLADNNYVAVYKRSGEDKSMMKVEKPTITPVKLNRKEQSGFATQFLSAEAPRLKPSFVDFKTAIQTVSLKNGVQLDYIKNPVNETFSLNYVLEMGSNADAKLALAVQYLPLLGTNKFTAAQLQQEFYKLGLSFDVFADEQRSYVSLSGLEESFTEGVKLFEHILKNVQPDATALKNMKEDILARRENNKKDKRTILRLGMGSFAKYGKVSPFTDVISAQALAALTGEELVAQIKTLTDYQHRVFYYGTKTKEEAAKILSKEHVVPKKLKPLLATKDYPELETG